MSLDFVIDGLYKKSYENVIVIIFNNNLCCFLEYDDY